MERFDFNNYSKDSKFFNEVNKNIIGKISYFHKNSVMSCNN